MTCWNRLVYHQDYCYLIGNSKVGLFSKQDILAHQDRIDRVSAEADKLIQANHFDAPNVASKRDHMLRRFEALKVRHLTHNSESDFRCEQGNRRTLVPCVGAPAYSVLYVYHGALYAGA